MEQTLDKLATEKMCLERCINDLASVLALPAIWSGRDSTEIVRTLLDALVGMLALDFAHARLKASVRESYLEIIHVAETQRRSPLREIVERMAQCAGDDPREWPQSMRYPNDDVDISIVPLPLGLQGELGLIVAGSRRLGFPEKTERLVMSVAANQAAIALQAASLLREQKRVAGEVDQRVARRTKQLAAVNEALSREIAERRLIDERLRREENELKRSQARNTAILESALDSIVTIDSNGRIDGFNPAAERTFGHRRDEVIGRPMVEVIVPPNLRERHRAEFDRYVATGETTLIGRRVEMTAMRADGGTFPVEVAITRMPLEGSASFTGFIRDITERKRVEAKLRESELELRQLTETIPEMLWRATPEGALDYCNARVLAYTGLSSKEIMGEGWTKLLHPDEVERTRQTWVTCLATGDPYKVEVRILHAPDHSYRWCVTSALPMRDEQGRILKWHGTVVDMHDWRAAQQELRNTQDELAHLMRVMTMGQLTASIAHEVNQPLASIVTNAQTGLRWLARPTPDVAKARELGNRVVVDARRATDIIDRIRAMASGQPPKPTLLSLDDIVEESAALLGHEFQSRGATVSLDLGASIPPVLGDRIQLQQVVVNLAINSVQAMARSESSRRQISMRTLLQGPETVCCVVEDSGPGIDPAHIRRLFDAFFTTKDSGMGMGLPISRSIIEAHGGRIHADNDSALGGARFTFALPANGTN